METIIKIHGIDENKLSKTKALMAKLGSPTIKACYAHTYSMWVALEGTHRVTAAEELGIKVIIEPVEYSEETLISIGITDAGYDDITVADYVDTAYASFNAGHYSDVEVTVL